METAAPEENHPLSETGKPREICIEKIIEIHDREGDAYQNWTYESRFFREKVMLQSVETIEELANMLIIEQTHEKQRNPHGKNNFETSILPMIACISSHAMHQSNYDPWVRWMQGIKNMIISGTGKLQNVWNPERENEKTLQKLKNSDTDHTLICIDAARFIASLLSFCNIPAHIVVTQGKKLPHAFNTFQNPDNGEFYAISTDAVGHFPKIAHAPSISTLLDNFESWQLVNSRAQGITEFVFLDTFGNKVGAYSTDTQKRGHYTEKNGISIIHTANNHKIISIERVSRMKTDIPWGNLRVKKKSTQNISRIVPNKRHSHALHIQDTKYSQWTGAILRGRQDIDIHADIAKWVGIFLTNQLHNHIVADKNGTSLPHITLTSTLWFEASNESLSIKGSLEWTSVGWNTLQNFWYALQAFECEWNMSHALQALITRIKLRVEKTGAYRFEWNIAKNIIGESLSLDVTGNLNGYALGLFGKEHSLSIKISVSGKVSSLLKFRAALQIGKKLKK